MKLEPGAEILDLDQELIRSTVTTISRLLHDPTNMLISMRNCFMDF